MKTIITLFISSYFLLCSATMLYAMRVTTFDEYNLGNIRYSDRVRLTTDVNDFDFETDVSVDVNSDGSIDFLENATSVSYTDEFSFYIGNASSRYAVNNVLLWVGVSGSFTSFRLNDVVIGSDGVIHSNDPTVIWPYQELKPYCDSVVLIDIEAGINKRTSINDPVSSSQPLPVLFNELESDDPDLRVYATAFGAIKSGFNSVSPVNSDVLFARNNVTVTPEPSSCVLFGVGSGLLMIKKKWGRK